MKTDAKASQCASMTTGQSAIATEQHALTEDFYVGEWLVKPKLNQLQQRGGEQTRHLEPRLAKLLCYLAANAQEVIDRDQLVALLWPRVIVNENSLTRAVSELRKQLALANDQDSIYIETIPKRGYRLVRPVEPVHNSASGPAADLAVASAALPFFTQAKQSVWAACCLTLVLAAWLQFDELPQQAISGAKLVADEVIYSEQLTKLQNDVVLSSSKPLPATETSTEAVLASDDNKFAYIEYDHTGSTLYFGELDSELDPVPVFNSQDILFNLAWSPIGNALLFAGKPTMTTAALFNNETTHNARLYSFDLDSFTLSVLIEKAPADLQRGSGELSLT